MAKFLDRVSANFMNKRAPKQKSISVNPQNQGKFLNIFRVIAKA